MTCSACTLAKKGCKSPCMAGRGPRGKWLLVGEAPGEKEDERGIPFIGGSGQFLRALLRDAGVRPEDVFYTNAVRCRPPHNADPTPKQLFACWSHLEAEIEAVRPERIVLAGGAAMHSVLGITGINKVANMPMRWRGIPVLPVLHPAYLLRVLNDRKEPSDYEVKTTIEAFKKFKAAKRKAPPKEPEITVVTDATALHTALSRFDWKRPVALDVETTGLDWTTDKLRTIAWAQDNRAVALTAINADTLGVGLMCFEDDEIVGQNLKFDLHFLARAVLQFRGQEAYQTFLNVVLHGHVTDTMVAAHWLDSSLPKGLKALAYLYGERGGYDRAVKDEGGFNTEVGLDELAHYNGMDAVVTWELWAKIGDGLPPWYRKVIMPLLVELFLMEERGLPVDKAWLQTLDRRYAAKIKRAEASCKRLTGNKEFNPGSLPQVTDALLHLNWKPRRTTPTGRPQLRAEDLDSLDLPLADAVRDHRKAVKMRSTYAVGMLERLRGEDRLHPSFNLTGTLTGRLSSERPNFQNVPRGPEVRGMLYPGPGWSIVEADFAQAELRVLAWYSKDDRLMKAAREGEDLHTLTAQEVFGVKKPTKEQRQAAKSVNFALMYGETPAGLAQQIGCSIEEASEYIKRYFQRFPGVRNWHEAVWKHVDEHGATQHAFGLRRWFRWWGTQARKVKEGFQREAINTPVQGTASELTSLAFIRYCRGLRERYKNGAARPYPVALVHDSIIVVAPTSKAKTEGKALAAAMSSTSDALGNAVRMDAETKIMARWGEEVEE